MKIHATCLVKNEADILQESLTSALHWCDYIYVFDNGSSDGTWELVNELAKKHLQIVPYKQDDVKFGEDLRADIFNSFRSNAGPQDWWCRLDADEFYIDDPRIFLAKIPDRFKTVYAASLNYYFTDQDAILYRQDPVRFLETPVQQRLRYYINNWGEVRFFRHSDDLVWTRAQDYGRLHEAWGGLPMALYSAPAYPVRIWLKHYQYRSPEQIELRLRTRRPAIQARGFFSHEMRPNWRSAATTRWPAGYEDARPEFAGACWEERIVPATSLDYDGFDRRYVVKESQMPEFPVRFPRSRSRLRELLPHRIRAFLGRRRNQTRLLLEQLLQRI